MLDYINILAAHAAMKLDEQVLVRKLNDIPAAQVLPQIIGHFLGQFGAGCSGIKFDTAINTQFTRLVHHLCLFFGIPL